MSALNGVKARDGGTPCTCTVCEAWIQPLGPERKLWEVAAAFKIGEIPKMSYPSVNNNKELAILSEHVTDL